MRLARTVIVVVVALALAPAAGAAPIALGVPAPEAARHAADSVRWIAADPASAVTRDVDTLAPEFRVKLDRVLERMRAEFGGDVEVVETLRSRARQEALYAQGRTTPGPVVTWTRNSAHLSGYAADVVVGSYTNLRAYARLATIAREEGLRTLLPRDPGHVELAGARGAADVSLAPAGSARALSRIVSSRGVPPTEPTVFASSPYQAALSGPASFRAGDAPDARDADPE